MKRVPYIFQSNLGSPVKSSRIPIRGVFISHSSDQIEFQSLELMYEQYVICMSFDVVIPESKLYTPSTLNIVLIQWHTHLNVCAVK